MPGHPEDGRVLDATESGDVPEAVLDRAADRLAPLEQRTRPKSAGDVDFDEHRLLTRRAAAESAVLLKNESVLPLAAERVAVIGELARTPRVRARGVRG
jgi:beta-glucosidase